MDHCDICGKETNALADYYCNLCGECRVKHTDIVLLRKMGWILNKIDDLEKPVVRRLVNNAEVKILCSEESCNQVATHYFEIKLYDYSYVLPVCFKHKTPQE